MAWSIMSPVGSNMRAGSSVLSTNAVSTTSEGEDVDPAPPPLLLPLLPYAARLAVRPTTQPETSNRKICIGISPYRGTPAATTLYPYRGHLRVKRIYNLLLSS